MSTTQLLELAIGPYGALALAVAAVIALWRDRQRMQDLTERSQDLFEEALKVIRDDLVPLVRDSTRRR